MSKGLRYAEVFPCLTIIHLIQCVHSISQRRTAPLKQSAVEYGSLKAEDDGATAREVEMRSKQKKRGKFEFGILIKNASI